jgi:hypothetical protein
VHGEMGTFGTGGLIMQPFSRLCGEWFAATDKP